MTIVLSLLFLGVGIAVIVNTVMAPSSTGQQFPRFNTPPVRNRRILPVAIGTFIALGGVALLLLSTAESP